MTTPHQPQPPMDGNDRDLIEFELGALKGKNRILSKALLDLVYVYESDFDEAAPRRPDWLRTAILIAEETPSTTQSQDGEIE